MSKGTQVIFFTADHHFFHANIIRFCNRPFCDVEEMNEVLISKWNSKIKEGDIVYHLGDFVWGKISHVEHMLDCLNGKIVLIQGSHDNNAIKIAHRFVNITPFLEIHEGGHHITLCHYALRVWPRSHYGSLHLYGHSHSRLEPVGKSWDVGVDNNNFEPLSLDEVLEIMKKRPPNPNSSCVS